MAVLTSNLAIVDPPGDATSGSCSSCDVEVPFSEGPIGWDQSDGGGPLCDNCLTALDEALGMVLRVRTLAVELGSSPEVFLQAGAPAALSRFFKGFAKRFGPANPTRTTGLVDLIRVFAAPDLDPRIARLFVEALSAEADEDTN